MDKKRLRAVLKVLRMEEECQKEKISANEVIFYKPKSKELAQKNTFCFAVSMLRDIVLSQRL